MSPTKKSQKHKIAIPDADLEDVAGGMPPNVTEHAVRPHPQEPSVAPPKPQGTGRPQSRDTFEGSAPAEGADRRVRFEHARYKIGAQYPDLVSQKLYSETKSKLAAAAGDVLRLRSPRKNLADAKAAYSLWGKVRSHQQADEKATQAQYPFLFTGSRSNVVDTVPMLRSTGVEPTGRQSFQDASLHQSIAGLEQTARRGGVSFVTTPGHAMMIAADPKTNTYRFFDPNSGIYRFDDPAEFAAQVTDHIDRTYNNSSHHPFAQAGLPRPQATMRAHLEVALEQGTSRSASLDSGVCAAMSAHTGRWFLEHQGRMPEHLDAATIGLPGFDLARTVGDIAEQHAKRGEYKKAIIQAFRAMELTLRTEEHQKLANEATKLLHGGRGKEALALIQARQKDNPNDAFMTALFRYVSLHQSAPQGQRPSAQEILKSRIAGVSEAQDGASFSIDVVPLRLTPRNP